MNQYRKNQMSPDEARDLYFRAKRKERRARRSFRSTLALISVAILLFAFFWNENVQDFNYYEDNCRQLEPRAIGDDPNQKSVILSCPAGR
jgi:hypothetical protein